MIHTSLTELIGNTPLLEITGTEGQVARIVVKMESRNPGGSAKDRVALSMIADAEERGLLRPGATIIEPTSGNTGVGLAWVAAARGYKAVFTMPETMSVERRMLLQAYGATVVLTPGAEGMAGAIRRAEALRDATEGAVILGQFVNPANPRAHELTTGEEIWAATEGMVDVVVAGIGTGGTISGTGRALKRHRADIAVVGVEPATSPVLTAGRAGAHGIQGIGAGFVPDTLDRTVLDEVMTVTTEDARRATMLLARRYGVLAGISSGAAFAAAMDLARRDANAGKMIVALLPDTGERYLSNFPTE